MKELVITANKTQAKIILRVKLSRLDMTVRKLQREGFKVEVLPC